MSKEGLFTQILGTEYLLMNPGTNQQMGESINGSLLSHLDVRLLFIIFISKKQNVQWVHASSDLWSLGCLFLACYMQMWFLNVVLSKPWTVLTLFPIRLHSKGMGQYYVIIFYSLKRMFVKHVLFVLYIHFYSFHNAFKTFYLQHKNVPEFRLKCHIMT